LPFTNGASIKLLQAVRTCISDRFVLAGFKVHFSPNKKKGKTQQQPNQKKKLADFICYYFHILQPLGFFTALMIWHVL
jgi:hypothetical protein